MVGERQSSIPLLILPTSSLSIPHRVSDTFEFHCQLLILKLSIKATKDFRFRTLMNDDAHSQTTVEKDEVKRAARKRMTERGTRA